MASIDKLSGDEVIEGLLQEGNGDGERGLRSRRSLAEEDERVDSACSVLLTIFAVFLVVITFPISLFMCIKVVKEYERAVIFRLGRIKKGGAQGPGLFFIIPCIDQCVVVDLRNPMAAVCNVSNYSKSTKLLASTTLRNILGTKTLAELLSEREAIAGGLKTMIDTATDPWGIDIERVEVKDVRLPKNMQRAMAAEAEATREARAKVIAAEGEQKASRALKEASDIISESPAALQLRYLQTLSTISIEKNSTIVFPIPIEMFAKFLK